jgi:hypothetical protein
LLNSGAATAAEWDLYIPSTTTDLRISNGTTDRVTIQNDGDVGIGTTSPTAKLDVDGSVSFDGAAVFNESGAAVDFRVEGDTEANLLFVDGSADRVGIGTSSPGGKLHVYGDNSEVTASQLLLRVEDKVAANEWTGIGLGGYNANTSKTAIIHERTAGYGVGSLHLCVNNTASTADVSKSDAKLTIRSGGNVGIGTTSAGYKLTVNGQPGANGYTAFTNYSDKRLKTNISTLDTGVLSKILQLNPVKFQYNEKYLQLYPNSDLERVHKGFIAQEIQKVFPEMVSEMKESPDSINYLDLDVSHLQVYLVQALQEQQAIIEAQKAENESQKQEIETIKAEASSSSVETNQKLKETAQKLAALEAKLNALLLLNSKGVVLTAEN